MILCDERELFCKLESDALIRSFYIMDHLYPPKRIGSLSFRLYR